MEAAAAIGQRLVHQAVWKGTTCTWEVAVSDRAARELRSKSEQTGGAIYQGTGGIAWFLAELHRATGEAEFSGTALGALRHSLAWGSEQAITNFGFHSGRVGVAYVAARLADLLEQPEARHQAWQLLEPLAGHEHLDRGLDLIAGAAGAIPALLDLRTSLGREELLTMARALGDHLISQAQQEPGGWSWRTIKGSAVRNVNGLAHGASGIGLALLELAAATGEGKYLFAAEMAFLYERQFWNPQAANWPDWRNQEIGHYTYTGRQNELRREALAGRVPSYRLHYMTAWCHGSPGIGLARLRAFELTGQELYREEAAAAVPSTLRSIEQREASYGNYSLCHGIAGNCEFPLLAAALLDDPGLRAPCEQALTDGWETYEQGQRPWPCGTANGDLDPSLLVGEAGIGFSFLRLAEQVDHLPSPLLLRPPYEVISRQRMVEGYQALAHEAAKGYFRGTAKAFDLLCPEGFEFPLHPPGDAPLLTSPTETAFEALRQKLLEQERNRQELLADAFLVERMCYQLTRQIDDFTSEYLHDLTRPSWQEVDPTKSRFTVAQGGRLVTTRWPWARWLQAVENHPGDIPVTPPPARDTYFLLHRKGNRFHPQQLGPLAVLLLDAVESPASLADLVARVADALDGADLDRDALTNKVMPQLEELYRAGFVDCLR